MANQITKMATKTAKQIIIIIFFCEKREKKWIDYWIVAFFHGNTWTPTHTDVFWKNMGRLCVCAFWGREEIFTFMLKNFAQTSLQRTEFWCFSCEGYTGNECERRHINYTSHHSSGNGRIRIRNFFTRPFSDGEEFCCFCNIKTHSIMEKNREVVER